MNKVIIYSIVVTVLVLVGINLLHKTEPLNFSQYELKQKYATKPTSSVDHSKFTILQKQFKTPQDVTLACLSCHNKRHEEIIHSSHWNWERVAYVEGKGNFKNWEEECT